MSAEMITTLVGVVGILLALAAGFGWMVHRMDVGDAKLADEISEVRRDLTEVRREVSEVKVAIARLEGPQGPQLMRAH